MLKKEVVRFITIGVFGTLVDYSIYIFSLDILGVVFSKVLAFVCGGIIAFTLNKIWTFENKDKVHFQLFKFVMLYLFTLFINVSVNSLILSFLEKKYLIAFTIATGIHTVLNFLGQKFWVFKEKK